MTSGPVDLAMFWPESSRHGEQLFWSALFEQRTAFVGGIDLYNLLETRWKKKSTWKGKDSYKACNPTEISVGRKY